MISQKTFIFFGRSGCGKGTQANKLMEYLRDIDPGRRTLYVETGARFREFMQEANHTSGLIRDIIGRGGLLPGFLPVWIWTDYLIRNTSGNEHIIFDGLSRRPEEAPVLDHAIRFYNRPETYVIHINVSSEWASKRLLARGRADDTSARIEERMRWYDADVIPAIEYFKSQPGYIYLEINGEQDMEAVTKELFAGIKW